MSPFTSIFTRWLPPAKGKYERVDSSDRKNCGESLQSPNDQLALKVIESPFHLKTIFLLCLIISVSAGSLGFFSGRHLPPLFSTDTLLAPAGNIRQTWHYNRTFSDPPSPVQEAAWMSIFPKGRGFFAHPSLKVNISGIAVFHELHCLHGIRLAFYDALNHTSHAHAHEQGTETMSSDAEDAKIDAANSHNDLHHVRHCFDYLRQALMCAADTNLEMIDWSVGGSTGWGFERECRNYEDVVKWAEKWRYHSQSRID